MISSFYPIAIILGAFVGSFLNVVILRLPRGESIITPRSYCPICNNLIRWYDSIPIISWLALGKKCRNCHQKISIQYPLIEFSTVLLFLLSIQSQPSSFQNASSVQIVLSGWLLLSILIPLTIIDLKHLWLPQSICIVGIISGLFLTFVYTLVKTNIDYSLIINHSSACFSGFLIIRVIAMIANLLLRKPSLGLGDAKLTAVLGCWLGFKGLFIALYIAFISSGIFSLVTIFTKKLKFGQPFPLGPFLTTACFTVWFLGDDLFIHFL